MALGGTLWGDSVWGCDFWGGSLSSESGVPLGDAFDIGQGLTSAVGQRARLLGKDIYFRNDYQINPSGDFVLLSGIEALRQSILNRLITKPGEFRQRPTYGVGVPLFVKKKRTPTVLNQLRQRIIDQLQLEPRIEQITDLSITNTGSTLVVNLKIVAAGEALTFQPFAFNEVGSV